MYHEFENSSYFGAFHSVVIFDGVLILFKLFAIKDIDGCTDGNDKTIPPRIRTVLNMKGYGAVVHCMGNPPVESQIQVCIHSEDLSDLIVDFSAF